SDVPYVEFAQAVYQGAENNDSPEPAQLLVTLTRSGALNMPADVEVQVTPDSAMEGMDYGLPFSAPISVFFEPWQRTQTIAIDIFGDGQFEGTESIDLELISLYGPTEIGTQSTARIDIIDAEAGYVEFAQANYQLNEGDTAPTEITLTRTGQLERDVEVEVTIAGGSATQEDDFYSSLPLSVYFAPGQTTQTIPFDALMDGQPEGLETIELALRVPFPGDGESAIGDQSSATISIIDSDVPSVEFAQTDYRIAEGDNFGAIEVTLTRSGDINQQAEVNLFVQGGTAILDEDFWLGPTGVSPIYFAPGQTSQTVFIDVVDDFRPELDETAILAIEGVGNTAIGLNQSTTLTIEDNDVATVQFSQTDYSVNESASQVTLTLTRTGNLGRSDQIEVIAINNIPIDGNAQQGSDFNLSSSFVQFMPGEASQTVAIDIVADGVFEASESAIFQLVSNGETLIGDQQSARLTIIDTGTNGADIFVGSETDDVIKAKSGDDSIQGLGGNDQLDGNSGQDIIDGGNGDDTIKGGNHDDDIDGGSGNDKLYGHKGNDLIEGGDGNDFLNGGPGNDTLRGELGNDLYIVDSSGDIVEEVVNGGTDEVRSYTAWSLGSYVENLMFLGSAAIDGIGNAGNNTLKGNKSANQLEGLAGNDFLKGQNGDDTLIGVDQASSTPGKTEIDTLNGGGNSDLFILGNVDHVFYDDGDGSSAGLGDYALIADFKTSQQDQIQLKGNAANYRVANSPLGTGGKALYYQVAGEEDELIAIVKGSSNLDLNSSSFSFVS
ncbi:MAG: Calx-beta domain-containing protein, partial [Cyanobacteria bacterium P01_F01_bin.150]